MSTYKLTYFNGGGRGETTRLIFHVAGQAFVDNRVEFSEWPEIKPSELASQSIEIIIGNNQSSQRGFS